MLPDHFREEGCLPVYRVGSVLDQTADEHTLDGFRDLWLTLVRFRVPGVQEQAIGQLRLLLKPRHQLKADQLVLSRIVSQRAFIHFIRWMAYL